MTHIYVDNLKDNVILSDLSIKERVIASIQVGNRYRPIESFYLDEELNCYCKFHGDCYIHDFSEEVKFAADYFKWVN